ncbi:porin [uncultured Aquabacterium sp.]|jgi:predicted porin|uniref:porin n=1 Tax=uncultured Aquabacterium sp. TaxID=158753 RepID=UPI002605C395|nr:porin [uncultured Aquabacterium sp.]
MHTKLATIALAAAAAASPFAASAQSSVTLYGLVDMYLQYGKGDSTTTTLQSGGLNGSRLGFKGAEDLGNGLKAVFQLEMGINADTGGLGQNGLAFGRQAYVGLQSSSWGQVNLGRQYTLQFVNIDAFDAFTTGLGSGVASSVLSTTVRADNAITYKSPTVGGFTGQAMVGLGENSNPGQKSYGNLYSLAGNYAAGPFSASLTLTERKRADAASQNTRWTLVGAAYDFGSFKLLGGVQWAKDLNLGTLVGGTTNRFDDRLEGYLGVNVPVTAKDTVTAAIAGSRASDLDGYGASEFSLGLTHTLSKRTAVYTVGSLINNGRATNWTASGATGSGPVTSIGKDVRALQVGIRHAF